MKSSKLYSRITETRNPISFILKLGSFMCFYNPSLSESAPCLFTMAIISAQGADSHFKVDNNELLACEEDG